MSPPSGSSQRLAWRFGRLRRLSPFKRWCVVVAAGLVLVLGLILAATWDDIMQAGVDPKEPFQTYVRRVPKAPDYGQASAWALNPAGQTARQMTGPVDVFFVHPTTFNGGRDWNGPIDDKPSARQLERVMLPNYAGPFARVGRVFAPRYRQASLYAYRMKLGDDSRDARRFAYGDVLNAFRFYMAHYNFGRPYIVVGVEQGGDLADRLLREEIEHDPTLSAKLVAAYLIDAVIPAAGYGPGAPIPACRERAQARCVVGWASVDEDELGDGAEPLEPRHGVDARLDARQPARAASRCFASIPCSAGPARTWRRPGSISAPPTLRSWSGARERPSCPARCRPSARAACCACQNRAPARSGLRAAGRTNSRNVRTTRSSPTSRPTP